MYYLAYNPQMGNALVAVSETELSVPEGIVVETHTESLPDLSKVFWNTSLLQFDTKYINEISKKDFIKRLTSTEYAIIKAAALQNPELDYYWQLFMQAQSIILDDIDTTRGVWMLEIFGLIGAGRALEILA